MFNMKMDLYHVSPVFWEDVSPTYAPVLYILEDSTRSTDVCAMALAKLPRSPAHGLHGLHCDKVVFPNRDDLAHLQKQT